MLGSVDSLF